MARTTEAWVFAGDVKMTNTASLPDASVVNENVSTASPIDGSRTVHRHAYTVQQATGSDVVTATTMIHVARAAGTVKSVEVRPITAPTGGDKQFTVDVAKAANASGTWASVLNAAEVVDNTSVDNTLQEATLATTPTFSDGDALRVVVTASGSTGSQGDGVIITVNIDEDPD